MMRSTQIHLTNQPGKEELSAHDQHILKLIEENNTVGLLIRCFPDGPKSKVVYWVHKLRDKGFVTLKNVWS